MAVPGIEGYLDMRPLRLAESVMAGYQAGMQSKRDKEAAAERERARADRLALEQQRLLQEFGPDAVIEPESGIVDIARSAQARQKRLEGETIAEAIGQQEAIQGWSRNDISPEIRQSPGYLRGQARAAADMARQQAIIDRYTQVEELRAKGAEKREDLRQMYRMMGDLFKEEKPAAGEMVTITEDLPGGGRARRSVSKAEFEAIQKQKTEQAAAAEDPYAKAREAAEEAKRTGKSIDLEMKNGIPVIEKSLMFPDDPDEVIRRIDEMERRAKGKVAMGPTSRNAPVIRIQDLLRTPAQ